MRRLLAAAVLLAACRGMDGPGDDSPVKSITVSVAQSPILVGTTTQAVATLFDAMGNPIFDRIPTWVSLTPEVLSVTPAGIITGLQPGAGTVRAASGAVTGQVTVIVRNPLAGSITFSRDTATVFIPGGSVQLIASVNDTQGNPITNPTIFWQSTAAQIATVNATGLVTGVAAGSTTIRASTDGKTAQATISVQVTPASGAPLIVGINPLPLRPGGTYTVVGNNFGATAAQNAVLVDGVGVTVNAANANAMSVTLPATGFACEPSRTVYLQVAANGLLGAGAATLQAPNDRTLAPGQSVVISDASEVRCNELAATGGRYVFSVYNAHRSAINPGSLALATVTVRGAASTAAVAGEPPAGPQAQARRPAPRLDVPLIGSAAFDAAESMRAARDRDGAHARLLERNIAYLRSLPAGPRRARTIARADGGAFAAQLATVGSITTLKVPNIEQASFCSQNTPIGVRTVFVGERAIIVEDTISTFGGLPTLQGQMDAYFTQLGQEFDTVLWPILTTNFGNPLVLDAQLSGTGKVVMVFSPRVNSFLGGSVLGFVVTCDLTPVSQSPSSNVGEYFYAPVPTSTAAGYVNGQTRDSWMRVIRATVVHEVKHITSFAERLSRSLPLEELSWEEGMARHSEELYARSIYGTPWKGNTSYAASIACDLRFTGAPPCAGRPVLMLRHFDNLSSYFASVEALSPLGRAFVTDASFYGSAWSVERWALDHVATNEAQFLKDWTTGPNPGVLNLEARTGRTWDELLGEWSLAMYLDDEPAFTPANPRLAMPSWNMRDIFAGLCADLGPCTNPTNPINLFPKASPWVPKALQFGTFSQNAFIAGGSFSIFELTGTQAGRQLIELRSTNGSDPPANIRLAIVRIQ